MGEILEPSTIVHEDTGKLQQVSLSKIRRDRSRSTWQLKDWVTAAIAGFALIVSAFAAFASWQSYSYSRMPILVEHCETLRGVNPNADYVMIIGHNYRKNALNRAIIPDHGSFTNPDNLEYQQCDLTNLGAYPLLKVQPSFTVMFSADTDGARFSTPIDRTRTLTFSGEIAYIPAKSSVSIEIDNNDTCLSSLTYLNSNVSYENIPYKKLQYGTFSGWSPVAIPQHGIAANMELYSKDKSDIFNEMCRRNR